jgi:hypothetical protein
MEKGVDLILELVLEPRQRWIYPTKKMKFILSKGCKRSSPIKSPGFLTSRQGHGYPRDDNVQQEGSPDGRRADGRRRRLVPAGGRLGDGDNERVGQGGARGRTGRRGSRGRGGCTNRNVILNVENERRWGAP